MAVTLALQELAFGRSGKPLAKGLTLAFVPGSVTVLAGPNGAGKSTMLDCLAGELEPLAGQISYGGTALAALPLHHRARLRAMLRQQSDIAFDFPVADVVAMGLSPFGIGENTSEGRILVARALDDLELTPMAALPATRLSGGEAQRVHIARALVQLRAGMAKAGGGLLLMDEPTTGLDYRHQLALLGIVREAAESGATVVATLHDLDLACRMADRLLMLGAGRLVADVPPCRLDPATVAALYGIPLAEAARLLGSRADRFEPSLAAE